MSRVRCDGGPLGDLLYVSLTIGFFAAMLAYVAACERVGRRGEDPEGER